MHNTFNSQRESFSLSPGSLTHLHPFQFLEESVSHTPTNNHHINFIKKIMNQLYLVMDFSTGEKERERERKREREGGGGREGGRERERERGGEGGREGGVRGQND